RPLALFVESGIEEVRDQQQHQDEQDGVEPVAGACLRAGRVIEDGLRAHRLTSTFLATQPSSRPSGSTSTTNTARNTRNTSNREADSVSTISRISSAASTTLITAA